MSTVRPGRVRVGRVVLEGFAPHEHAAVIAAIEASLAAPAPIAPPPRPVGRVEAGSVPARPSAIGAAVAAALPGRRS